MNDFYAQLSDVLELDQIEPSQVLRDLPEWDSLAALSVIAMINSNYRITVSAAELRASETAEALQQLVAAKTGK
jgi:acyl carrier protein